MHWQKFKISCEGFFGDLDNTYGAQYLDQAGCSKFSGYPEMVYSSSKLFWKSIFVAFAHSVYSLLNGISMTENLRVNICAP